MNIKNVSAFFKAVGIRKFITLVLSVIMLFCTACGNNMTDDYNPFPQDPSISEPPEDISAGTASLKDDVSIWLPDPCTALNVDGEYNQTNTEDNGVTYDYYTYDFDADYDSVADFIVTYTEALKNMGFDAKKLNNLDNTVWYEKYSYNDSDGAELAIFVSSGAEEISNGGIGTWRIVLAVPTCFIFILGNGAPGVVNGNTVCIGCKGNGKCAGCSGTGSADYGDGYETCIICGGTGICNICDGEGSY